MALELKDKTANLNDFTINNGVSQVTDAPASLTGSTYAAEISSASSLSLPDTTYLSITGDMSIEFWQKTSATDGSYLIYKYVDPTTRSYQFYGASDERHTFINSDDGSTTGNSSTGAGVVATDGAWHHYAITYTAAGPTMASYKDGVLAGTWTNVSLKTSIFDGTAPFTVGNLGASAVIRLCDIRVWNTAISSGSVSARYTTLLAGTETNLVANWQFQPFTRGGATGYMKTGKFW